MGSRFCAVSYWSLIFCESLAKIQSMEEAGNQSFEMGVRNGAPGNAARYRLQFERDGKLRRAPKHSLALFPFEEPEVPSGLYSILYFDSTETPIRHKSVRLQWENPTRREKSTKISHVSRELELAGEASEAAFALELERSNFKTKNLHGRSALVADSIALFRSFHQAMGAQTAQDYKIRNEQMALLAESSKLMIQSQLAFMESSKSHYEKLQTPPEPPQWDKIAAVLGPPVAAVCVELVRAIRGGRKGAVKDEPSVAELLVPSDARLKSLYELLGKVADADRLEEMLSDPKNFQSWVASVKTAMSQNQTKSDVE